MPAVYWTRSEGLGMHQPSLHESLKGFVSDGVKLISMSTMFRTRSEGLGMHQPSLHESLDKGNEEIGWCTIYIDGVHVLDTL